MTLAPKLHQHGPAEAGEPPGWGGDGTTGGQEAQHHKMAQPEAEGPTGGLEPLSPSEEEPYSG